MNKPNPEFEIDDPAVLDEQGRSPNRNEAIAPDASEIETETTRSGEPGIANRPADQQDEDATDAAVDHGEGVDDLEGENDVSAPNEGEAGNLGRDAGATQGSQKMTGRERSANE